MIRIVCLVSAHHSSPHAGPVEPTSHRISTPRYQEPSFHKLLTLQKRSSPPGCRTSLTKRGSSIMCSLTSQQSPPAAVRAGWRRRSVRNDSRLPLAVLAPESCRKGLPSSAFSNLSGKNTRLLKDSPALAPPPPRTLASPSLRPLASPSPAPITSPRGAAS